MHMENTYAYPVTESGSVSFLLLHTSEHQAALLQEHILEPPELSPFPCLKRCQVQGESYA